MLAWLFVVGAVAFFYIAGRHALRCDCKYLKDKENHQ